MKLDDTERYAGLLINATEADLLADATLEDRLLLGRQGDISVQYAPFDYIQRGARLVIVGITPGLQQARNALLEARRRLLDGADWQTALRAAKTHASFSGPMRTNLVAMLDHIGLNRWLGVSSTSEVWSTRTELVHFTSALRYPVFVGRKNYSGSPSMTTTPILNELLANCLREEVAALPDAVWVPLGPRAAEGITPLAKRGILPAEKLLVGLPHPSGANAERIAYFLGRKSRTLLSSKTSAEGIEFARDQLLAQVSALPNNDFTKVAPPQDWAIRALVERPNTPVGRQGGRHMRNSTIESPHIFPAFYRDESPSERHQCHSQYCPRTSLNGSFH